MRGGFTLVECMLASAIFGLMVLVTFEGVIVSTKIAHENADLLAAEAVAWDAVWKRFNEDFDSLAVNSSVTVELSTNAAPQLCKYDMAPTLTVEVKPVDEAGFSTLSSSMKKIIANVEWGQAGNRLSLKPKDADLELTVYDHRPQVFRGSLGRTF